MHGGSKEAEILNVLSAQLRQEILLHTCRRLVENVSFFNNLPAGLLLRIVLCMRAEMFLANDVVVKAGARGECMYFITSGTVAVYTTTGREARTPRFADLLRFFFLLFFLFFYRGSSGRLAFPRPTLGALSCATPLRHMLGDESGD
ncbi:hypothetical protein R5R35_006240 [Gryllus longicercus]|uniref:Cyclic nucleotide-binding domain-containing protein n=1 Tax=Gryllus longicercus TaxID=2509291 RepID=A0AAN9VZ21_9ORTH